MADIEIRHVLPEQIEEMRKWLRSKPLLPQNIDDDLLRRFVHSCYFDVEKAKAAAELFFTIRGSSPELLKDRDPLSPRMMRTLKSVNLAQLEISGDRNLWIWQLNDPGLEVYDYVQDAKTFLLSTDAWLLENKRLEEADIVVMDAKDISLKFLTKFNISVARKISKYQQGAVPIRLKQIHVLNAPPFIDKIFSLMKPIMSKEITEMIHFHKPNSETIYQYIDKEELPNDYGGSLGTMDDLMKTVMETIVRHREILVDPNLWTATKHKKNDNDLAESASSLRTLVID